MSMSPNANGKKHRVSSKSKTPSDISGQELSPVKVLPQPEPVISADHHIEKIPDDSAIDNEMTDAEFIRQFRNRRPEDRLVTELKLAQLCARKKQFDDRRAALKALGISETTFSKYLLVGQDDRMVKLQSRKLLSPKAGYSLLYEIAQLTDEQMDAAIAKQIVGPNARRATVERFRNGEDVSETSERKGKTAQKGIFVIPPANFSAEQMTNFAKSLSELCKQYGCSLSSDFSEVTVAPSSKEQFAGSEQSDNSLESMSESEDD